jgi:hypothetical protein
MSARCRKRISLYPGPVTRATAAGRYWAMKFVHDEMMSSRKFRLLTFTDKWYRQWVALQTDFALTGQSVVDALNAVEPPQFRPDSVVVNRS